MTGQESAKEIRVRLAELRICANIPGDVPLPVCSSCRRAVIESTDCIRCGRIFHASCLDDIRVCRDCISAYIADERSREIAGRLALSISSPSGDKIVFLFAQRTLLAGRARRSQGSFLLPAELGAGSRGNDIVLRRVEEQDGNLHIMENESRLVSRSHLALSIRHEGGREELFVHDTGTDGKGSTCGTWLRGMRLPEGGKALLSSGDEILAGRESGIEGVSLNICLRRSGEAIQSVEVRRKDALSGSWLCIMVAGSAELICEQGKAAGSIRVADGKFIWSGTESGEKTLSSGEVLHEKESTVKVLEFDDALFWGNVAKS